LPDDFWQRLATAFDRAAFGGNRSRRSVHLIGAESRRREPRGSRRADRPAGNALVGAAGEPLGKQALRASSPCTRPSAAFAGISEHQQRFYAAGANGDRAMQQHAARTLAALDEERQRWRLLPGQLVILDEAAMSGTIYLAQLATQVRHAGAKLLLVGDHRQLGAVPAGGAFGSLARQGHSHPEGLWRFRHRWEAHATRQLRDGDQACLEIYQRHGRINGGDHEDMLDAAHAAWAADRGAGRTNLLVAADNATVSELNQRARTALVAVGQVTADCVDLRDGTTAGMGDLIVTRQNARRYSPRCHCRHLPRHRLARRGGRGVLRGHDPRTSRQHHVRHH
jgi:AAA domain